MPNYKLELRIEFVQILLFHLICLRGSEMSEDICRRSLNNRMSADSYLS